jgi:hypothetical protein
VTKAPTPSARLRIKVVPGSSRDEVVGWLGDALKIKVTAPPQKGRANEAVDLAMVADGGLVLGDEVEELEVVQATGLCLLDPDVEGGRESGEPELAERGAEVVVHRAGSPATRGTDVSDASRRRIGGYAWCVRRTGVGLC